MTTALCPEQLANSLDKALDAWNRWDAADVTVSNAALEEFCVAVRIARDAGAGYATAHAWLCQREGGRPAGGPRYDGGIVDRATGRFAIFDAIRDAEAQDEKASRMATLPS